MARFTSQQRRNMVKNQPRNKAGQFAKRGGMVNNRRSRVAGLGLPVNATRRISGRAIRRVRTT